MGASHSTQHPSVSLNTTTMFGGLAGCSGCGSLVAEGDIQEGLCASCRARFSAASEFVETHINEIVPGLFLGDLTSATNETILRRFGITHVVDVSGHNHVRLKDITY